VTKRGPGKVITSEDCGTLNPPVWVILIPDGNTATALTVWKPGVIVFGIVKEKGTVAF
jgi:hypothetical protein